MLRYQEQTISSVGGDRLLLSVIWKVAMYPSSLITN